MENAAIDSYEPNDRVVAQKLSHNVAALLEALSDRQNSSHTRIITMNCRRHVSHLAPV